MTGWQRGQVRDVADPTARRWAALSAIGLLGSTAVVLLTAPLQAEGARRLLGHWDVWVRRWAVWQREPRAFPRGGLIVLAAVVLLLCAWLLVGRLIAERAPPTRRLVWMGAAWALPFAVAPPVMSRDAYAYLAQGAVARAGGSPYRPPHLVLDATSQLLTATDPLYTHQVAPYGPLAVRIFAGCLALAGGDGLLALVLLRTLVLLCLGLTVWCCWLLAAPDRRPLAVWLIALNPLLLMDLVGGLHLEALLVALLAAAFVLVRRHPALASVAVVTAAAVKVTALTAFAVLVLDTFRRQGRRGLSRVVLAAVAAVAVLSAVLSPDAFGWVPALSAPLHVWNPISLPTAAALLLATVTGGSPLPLIAALRAVFLTAGVVGAVAVLWRGRSLPPASIAGYVIAVVTLTGPVLWPWYLVPAVVLLALGGGRGTTAAAVGVSVGAALSNLPMPMVQMQRVSAAGFLGVGAALLLWRIRESRRADPAGGVGWLHPRLRSMSRVP